MPENPLRRRPLGFRLTRPLRVGALLVATAVAATSLTAVSAQARTAVTPSEPGDPMVVRDASVTIDVDRAGMHYTRSSSSANYAPAAPTSVALSGCKGDNPAGTDASPRTIVTVTAPDGSTVLTSTSPVRDMGALSPTGFLGKPPHQPLTPQPAPSNTNYRGDFPGNTFHGFEATVNLSQKPAGIYTVTTTETNTYRTTSLLGSTACQVGTPVATDTGFGSTVTPGPVTTVEHFEYRPWQAEFKDVFGKGGVSVNIEPAEYRFSVDRKTSPVFDGDPQPQSGSSQQFYGLSGGFALPSDPAACVENPGSCLPADAVSCVPSQGCTPRVMLINRPSGDSNPHGLVGVFDLATKAFVAYATIDGTTRTLMSLGTTNDSYYRGVLDQLAKGAAAQGMDLASILATEVRLSAGSHQLSLSLLNGLQIDPTTKPGGVQIASGSTVHAGVVLNIYSSLRTSGGACVSNRAGSDSDPDRYVRGEDNGYTVTRSDLLPEVPKAGALGAIVGGPIYHIKGKFNDDALVNTSTAVIGVDTAADEPSGYPVWISPFVSGINTTSARTMEFLGTATWAASETPILTGCLVVDFMLGTGVVVYNNPLPVGFDKVFDPLTTPMPAAAQLTDAVNDAVAGVVDDVAANPVVSDLLTQVTGLLQTEPAQEISRPLS